ncbi:copper-binding protein [Sphingomonas oligophenolica]|uniref:Copper-binding protein n=2 Tax=Sphingomonas oligophenolica TaxID=301154 RepID=A0A502CKR7_9SPHN|nr:copper-binding protein [Sphingomonas oligophenolica]
MGVAPAHADPDWSRAKVLEVDLSSFAYTPATITLQHGTPYRLHLVNTSGGGHDFVAKEFFAQATLDPANRSIVDKGKVAVDGGESVEVDLVATRAGTYDVHCSHFMHSTFGMKGRIIVL